MIAFAGTAMLNHYLSLIQLKHSAVDRSKMEGARVVCGHLSAQ
jgi:hypothetical protein